MTRKEHEAVVRMVIQHWRTKYIRLEAKYEWLKKRQMKMRSLRVSDNENPALRFLVGEISHGQLVGIVPNRYTLCRLFAAAVAVLLDHDSDQSRQQAETIDVFARKVKYG